MRHERKRNQWLSTEVLQRDAKARGLSTIKLRKMHSLVSLLAGRATSVRDAHNAVAAFINHKRFGAMMQPAQLLEQ
jgi:hypothetical protein